VDKGLHHSNTIRIRELVGHNPTDQTSVVHKHRSSLALIRPVACLHRTLTFTRPLVHSNQTVNSHSSNLFDRHPHRVNRLISLALDHKLSAMQHPQATSLILTLGHQ
jgi:hypothetical protein